LYRRLSQDLKITNLGPYVAMSYSDLRSRVERILCSGNVPNANFGRELLIEPGDQVRDSRYLVNYFDGYNVPGCVDTRICTRCTLDVHFRLPRFVKVAHIVIR